jgi:ribulose-phosphate 3-epimerase
VEKAGSDGIHLDVMDGHFVPNISFGPAVIRSIRKTTTLPFWAHLMIQEPDRYIDDFYQAGTQGIFVHPETGKNLKKLSDQIHRLGMQAGVALNPETPIDVLINDLDHFERILMMTVHPGFGGQVFIPEVLDKIVVLKQNLISRSRLMIIEVDGGVNEETAPRIVRAGAEALVIGSAIFHSAHPGKALRLIRREAEKAAYPE